MNVDAGNTGWGSILKSIQKDHPKQKDDNGFRRALLWGMAIHSATDIFAHSAFVSGQRITHATNPQGQANADNPQVVSERFYDAYQIANQIMRKYTKKERLLAEDLVLPYGTITYKIKDMYSYVLAASDESTAAKAASYTYGYAPK